MTTPVAFLIFRRPQQTARVFEAIRAARPPTLLIVADGPRVGQLEDVAACQQTRQIAEQVDWPCQVLRNYAPQNMGCKQRVWSGLQWVFEQVQEAIILEDDCLPHPTFFRFCDEMLDRYRHEDRVGWIAGTDLQMGRQITPDSYHFARNAHIWGWATWHRAWEGYDGDLRQWPALRNSNWLEELLQDPAHVRFWKHYFDLAHAGRTAWDVPWVFSNWVRGRLAAAPNVNLVSNIGFAAGATGELAGMNPIFHRLFSEMPARAMTFPLRHPGSIEPSRDADDFSLRTVCGLDVPYVRRKIAESWLQAAPGEFGERLRGDWVLSAAKILSSGVRGGVIPTEDQHWASNLITASTHMAPAEAISGPITDLSDPQAVQRLLAAMLYLRADQIPELPLDVEKVPDWLRTDFLKFIHDPPAIFTEPGDSDRYGLFLERWMDQLLAHVDAAQISQPWWDAALSFTQTANFIGVYFSRRNLKSLYEKRARLMDMVLRRLGHAIDHTFPPRDPARKKIRLGVLAAHYSPQTETFDTVTAYEHLNRDRFEIILYTCQSTNSRMERYCAGHADAMVTLPAELPQMAATIRQADLDVLWIGTNVTAVTNLVALLSLHRLARLQVNSVSSCATSGMRNVDCYVTGKLCEPSDAQSQYTERLLMSDGPAHVIDLGPEKKGIATEWATRESLGIGKDEFVYASGANFYKIIPEVASLWASVLARVPRSRLLLYPFNPNWSNAYPVSAFVERMQATLTAAGVDKERLTVLMPAPSRADVLNRLALADVYLDSFPFTGVNSLLDSLEAGLPTLVMDGNSFRSLMGPSLVRDLGIEELIAPDEAAYAETAVRLAQEPELRRDLAGRVVAAMKRGPRFLNSEWYSEQVEQFLVRELSDRRIISQGS